MASSASQPTLSVKRAIVESWEKLKTNLGTLILSTVILLAVSGILSYLRDALNPNPGHFNGTSLILTTGVLLINTILGIGLTRMALQVIDGKKPQFSDLQFGLSSGSMLWQYIVAQIIITVIVVIGTVLLIVPGIYLALTYGLVQSFIIDKDISAREAMRQSSAAMNGNRLKLLGLFVALIVINIVGALLIGVGLLISIPFSVLAVVHAYRQLVSPVVKITESVA